VERSNQEHRRTTPRTSRGTTKLGPNPGRGKICGVISVEK